jgi:hypothetical protein
VLREPIGDLASGVRRSSRTQRRCGGGEGGAASSDGESRWRIGAADLSSILLHGTLLVSAPGILLPAHLDALNGRVLASEGSDGVARCSRSDMMGWWPAGALVERRKVSVRRISGGDKDRRGNENDHRSWLWPGLA